MKSADLFNGMEVAVQSSKYLLGDSHGPARCKILECDVYDPLGRGERSSRARTKHRVVLLDRQTGESRETEYWLDGKNIICRWADVEKPVIANIEAAAFEEHKRRIQSQLIAEQLEANKQQMQRIFVLANVLGITHELQEVSRYSNSLTVGHRNGDMDRLEEILTEAMKNRSA